jgi:hypothetical protein
MLTVKTARRKSQQTPKNTMWWFSVFGAISSSNPSLIERATGRNFLSDMVEVVLVGTVMKWNYDDGVCRDDGVGFYLLCSLWWLLS